MTRQLDRNLARLRTIEKTMMPIGLILSAALAVWLFLIYTDFTIFDRIIIGVFAFIMLSRFIIGGVPKIIYHGKKVHRTLFLLLWPVGAALVFYLLYLWWNIVWLAALLGLILGFVISIVVGYIFFKDVAMEDQRREEKVSDFLVEEQLMKNPDAVAMKERFSSSEWEEIRTFPNMILGLVAMPAKNQEAVLNEYANAITKPEKFKDPLVRMMMIDVGADVEKSMGQMDGVTRLSTAVTGSMMHQDLERMAQSGTASMSQEGFFTFTPENMHTIKNNLSQDEYRSFVNGMFEFAMDLVNTQGKPDPKQLELLMNFFATFAESKQDLFSILGIKKS